MRDLTEEELELAPDWATHYYIYSDGDILFECESESALYRKNTNNNENAILTMECDGICFKSIPINKKPLDITKHEFSDKDIRLSSLCESKIELAVDDCGIEHYLTFNKSDSIAIAKALGVTGEDLK